MHRGSLSRGHTSAVLAAVVAALANEANRG